MTAFNFCNRYDTEIKAIKEIEELAIEGYIPTSHVSGNIKLPIMFERTVAALSVYLDQVFIVLVNLCLFIFCILEVVIVRLRTLNKIRGRY